MQQSSDPTNVEALHFITGPGEDLPALALVNALVGVTNAIDYGVNFRDDDHEIDTRDNLAVAARLLAEQLQARLSQAPARRRGRAAR